MRLNTEFGIIFKVFDEFVLGILSVKTRRRANAKDMGFRMISRKYLPVRIDKKVQKRFDLVFECGVFSLSKTKVFRVVPQILMTDNTPGANSLQIIKMSRFDLLDETMKISLKSLV